MHINDLCEVLKTNKKDCLAFFAEVEDTVFFKHFKAKGVFVFSTYLDVLMCQYIVKCCESKVATTKDIIDILKYNIHENWGNFQLSNLFPLLDILSFSEIEYQVEIPKKCLSPNLAKYLIKRRIFESTGLTREVLQYVDDYFMPTVPV